ncbi:MAG TPA: IPT/TIG domain-containing protein [Clostridia bacterium]|nr:IPT/TIG domain-containing protein [Clostridia bacterium]
MYRAVSMQSRKLSYFLSYLLMTLFFVSCGGGGGSQSGSPSDPSNTAPQISSLSPMSVIAGSSATTLTINGSGFIAASTVQWNSASHASTLVSANQINVSLTEADTATAATVQVKVTNPAPGGGTASASFTINNPVPTVSAITPTTANAGQPDTTVTITGTGFNASSVVNVNGASRVTTFVNSTQLKATLPTTDFSGSGTLQIIVTNPAPGGGTSVASSATTVTVNNPVPVLQSISQGSVSAGTPATLTVTGTGFAANSVVQVNGAPRATTYVGATQLRFATTAADVAAIATLQISVMNPAPGGGTTTELPVAVVYPVPTISSLNPPAATAGAGSFVLSVQGSGFFPTSTVQWNGVAKPTQYVSATKLTVPIMPADIATTGTAQVTVMSPAPGGGTSTPVNFRIDNIAITDIHPQNLYVGSRDTLIDIYGGNFQQGCVAQWNGAALVTTFGTSTHIQAAVPASSLTQLGTGQVTVANPDGVTSAAVAIGVIANPVLVLSSLSPRAAPAGSASIDLTLMGTGFTNASTAYWDSKPLPTTLSSGQLRATLSAALLQKLGTYNVTVTNPGPGGGGTSSALVFSTYLPLPSNDLVYSAWSKLLYASVPSTAGSLGNSIVGVDPVTGNVMNSVYVGSEPNKLALSSDGKVLWVGINGAGAVRKVDLVTMTAGIQFGLGGGQGVYNPPATALDLAVMPGSPEAVAVYTQAFPNATIRIFDSGVARANAYTGGGYLAFNSMGNKLYTMASPSGWGSGYAVLTIDSSGIASSTVVGQSVTTNGLKYDNGRVYTSNGTMLDAETGSLVSTFYSQPNSVASGAVAPDSTIGKAFIVTSSYSSSSEVLAFDTNAFVKTGSIPVTGLDTSVNPRALVRWGQQGLAFRTKSQIYVLQSNIVKDTSATLADVAVTLSAPASAATGASLTYTATVTNNGPNAANNIDLITSLPAEVTVLSATPAQGTCSVGVVSRCNLGSVAANSNVQVQLAVIPNAAGSLAASTTVSATEGDPTPANNSATTSVTATGNPYYPVPLIASISPKMVAVGADTFTLTVNGGGFNMASTVQWNGNALPTTFTDGSTLTATVDSSHITNLGYAWISVSSPSPGGGTSASIPLMIYRQINLDANQITYEPFRRKIYVSVPSTATQVTGNSIVSIDPATGALSNPVNIGSQPNQLALSDDGNYLFVGLDGSNSIARFNLATNTTDFSFSLGSSSYGDTYKPRTFAVAPGNANLLAVDTGSWTGIGIYDISGSTATHRAIFTGPYTGSSVAFGDSTHLYSYDSDTSGAEFSRWTVGASGLATLDNSTLNGIGGFSGSFKLSRGLVFGGGGGVADPSTTPPSMLGQFSAFGSVAPDAWLGRSFFLGCPQSVNYYCSSNNTLLAFDQRTFRQTDSVTVPTTQSGKNLIRWGSDGLAFTAQSSSGSAGTGELFILRGPFVIPQIGVANGIPNVASVTPSQLAAGSRNLYLTVTGTGFVAGAFARWNGSDRTTYFVDATHLSVAIPATDLASAGTASITVINPGSAVASAPVSFTISQ